MPPREGRRRSPAVSTARVIRGLDRVLRGLGYRVVPLGLDGPPAAGGRSPSGRRLVCPRCGRRFRFPMNLGRHLSASHGRRRKKGA